MVEQQASRKIGGAGAGGPGVPASTFKPHRVDRNINQPWADLKNDTPSHSLLLEKTESTGTTVTRPPRPTGS